MSLGELANSLLKAFIESVPVAVRITLSLLLRMNLHGTRSVGCVLRVGEHSDLETARHALILFELHAEHAWVFGLDAVCHLPSELQVVSAATELDQQEVRRGIGSSE